MDFATEFSQLVARVESGLDAHLPPVTTRPTRLHEAMRYSFSAGGKRLRPVLVLATHQTLSKRTAQTIRNDALPAAVAIECLHTYSLIHDDLPCMDNDDLRRGQPTVHKAFDEATALLAGDALLTHAFALLAVNYAGVPTLCGALVRELSDAAGSRRLIGGQMEDLLAETRSDTSVADLEFIHLNKTAAMIEASLIIGGLIGSGSEEELSLLRKTGRHLGLAFQITDDVLDATSESATLGKTAGKDARANKATFVKLHGIARSRELAVEHTTHAKAALSQIAGDTTFLNALIDSMAHRIR